MRLEELEYVLNKKLSDDRVAAVHLLYNHPYTSHYMYTTRNIFNKHKLILHWVPADPTHLDPLLYSNKYLLGRIVVFINQDVYSGEGFEKMITSIVGYKDYLRFIKIRQTREALHYAIDVWCRKIHRFTRYVHLLREDAFTTGTFRRVKK